MAIVPTKLLICRRSIMIDVLKKFALQNFEFKAFSNLEISNQDEVVSMYHDSRKKLPLVTYLASCATIGDWYLGEDGKIYSNYFVHEKRPRLDTKVSYEELDQFFLGQPNLIAQIQEDFSADDTLRIIEYGLKEYSFETFIDDVRDFYVQQNPTASSKYFNDKTLLIALFRDKVNSYIETYESDIKRLRSGYAFLRNLEQYQ